MWFSLSPLHSSTSSKTAIGNGVNWKKLRSNVSRTDRFLSQAGQSCHSTENCRKTVLVNLTLTLLRDGVGGEGRDKGRSKAWRRQQWGKQVPKHSGSTSPTLRTAINLQPHNKCSFNSGCSSHPVISPL